jgi:hypothetical protein
MNLFSPACILFFLPIYIWAQTDSSFSNNTHEQEKQFIGKPDTSDKATNRFPILHLKSLISTKLENQIIKNPLKSLSEDETTYYNFTKEELNSGFSTKDLIAYRKNKEELMKILAKKYDECWWYRTKSLGQLLGVSDMLIKALEFGLLLF